MGRRKASEKDVAAENVDDGSEDGQTKPGKKGGGDAQKRGRAKKNMSYAEYSDEESDENSKGGKGKGKRSAPVDDEDSEGSDEVAPKKVKGGSAKKATPAKPKGKPAKKDPEDDEEEEDEEEIEDEDLEDEELEDEEEGEDEEGEDGEGEDSANGNAGDDEIPKDIPMETEHILKSSFRPGDFLVEKADKDKPELEMPVWRIEGKSLLQRYKPFKDENNDRVLYKNCSSYTGYTPDKKEVSLPVDVMILVNQKRNSIIKVLEVGKDQ